MYRDQIDNLLYALTWYWIAAGLTLWVVDGGVLIAIVAGSIAAILMDKHWNKMYTMLNS